MTLIQKKNNLHLKRHYFRKLIDKIVCVYQYIKIFYLIISYYFKIKIAEVANVDQYIAVYRSSMDTMFYVVGSYDENELILLSVLTLLMEILNNLLRYLD